MTTSNKLISKETVENILNLWGNIGDNGERLTVRNLSLYQMAFVHQSFHSYGDPNLDYTADDSFERLEIVGDACIGFAVIKYLYKRFPQEREGFMTKLRSRLVETSSLHRFARLLGLGEYILVSPQVEKLTHTSANKGRNNPSIYEDCFESFIGALVIDFEDSAKCYEYAERFLVRLIENTVDFAELITNNKNYKDTLQRYFQSLKWSNPVYDDLDEQGPSHMRKFVKGVFIKIEYAETLSDKVRDDIQEFHKNTIKTSSQSVSKRISELAAEKKAYIFGIACNCKKSQSEQECSKKALINIGIDLNW